MRLSEHDLVGINEISVRLGVPAATVHTWHHRGIMPPATIISKTPVWEGKVIEEWAVRTNHPRRSLPKVASTS